MNCANCDSNKNVQLWDMWVAGGSSLACYEEWKTRRWLCETCTGDYTVCEGCGILIDDTVSLPPDLLCPDCRKND